MYNMATKLLISSKLPVLGHVQLTEYLLVSDLTSKVLKSSTNYPEVKKLANLIRRGGGQVTIFKSTKA